jgi:hypothetical protein
MKKYNNIIFIINYNSFDEFLNLLKRSDFNSLQITKVVLYSNGSNLSESQEQVARVISEEKFLSIDFVEAKNAGYAHAINSCITFIKTNYSGYHFAFFSNADLEFVGSANKFEYYKGEIIGFPLFQNGKFLVSMVSHKSPLLPFSIRKILNSEKIPLGWCTGVHGGFMGLKIDVAINRNMYLPEEYFLYWEEMRFCYEQSRNDTLSYVSDTVIINHDGKKSVKTDDARYYLFRNGLHFYIEVVNSKTLFFLWILLNLFYVTLILTRHRSLLKVRWFYDAFKDYKKSRLGFRSSGRKG